MRGGGTDYLMSFFLLISGAILDCVQQFNMFTMSYEVEFLLFSECGTFTIFHYAINGLVIYINIMMIQNC